jgi:hypothetical protein
MCEEVLSILAFRGYVLFLNKRMFKFQHPVCATYRSIAENTVLMPSVND